jgi:hypothetical protein
VVAESGIEFQMDWTMLIDGISGIEHAPSVTPLYDDVIRFWRATGTGLDPKLQRFFPREYLLGFCRPTHFFPDDAYVDEHAAEIHKLVKAGVLVQVWGHGQIEAGKLADLVILDADPLDDIRNTRKIDRVMKSGVLYRGEDAGREYPNPEPGLRTYRFRSSPRGATWDR